MNKTIREKKILEGNMSITDLTGNIVSTERVWTVYSVDVALVLALYDNVVEYLLSNDRCIDSAQCPHSLNSTNRRSTCNNLFQIRSQTYRYRRMCCQYRLI